VERTGIEPVTPACKEGEVPFSALLGTQIRMGYRHWVHRDAPHATGLLTNRLTQFVAKADDGSAQGSGGRSRREVEGLAS
jgi:hypothetical protein